MDRSTLGFNVQGSRPEHDAFVERVVSVTEFVGLGFDIIKGSEAFHQAAELAARVAIALLHHSDYMKSIPDYSAVWNRDADIALIAALMEDETFEVYKSETVSRFRAAEYESVYTELLNAAPGSAFVYPDLDTDAHRCALVSDKRRMIIDPESRMSEEEYESTLIDDSDRSREVDFGLYHDQDINHQVKTSAELAKIAGWIKQIGQETGVEVLAVPSVNDADALSTLREVVYTRRRAVDLSEGDTDGKETTQ